MVDGASVNVSVASPAGFSMTGGGSQWTASISWFNNTTGALAGAAFTANTAYRAEITISPQTGWTLNGVANPGFTIAGATSVTRTANVVTAVFPANFAPVTNITDVPTTTLAAVPLNLTSTVAPSYATNQTIVWSVQDAGATGATITGNTLDTTAVGTVTVRATILDGMAVGTPYVQDFNITVTTPPAAPTITGPTAMSLTRGYAATVSGAFNITGHPVPTVTINVALSTGLITWDVAHNRLNIAGGLAAGTYTVTITAANGINPNATHTFTLTVQLPVLQQPPPTQHPSPTFSPSSSSDDDYGWTPAPTPTQPSPTPVPTPVPSPTPPPALPLVWVELSQRMKTELETLIGSSDIDINIETSAPDTTEGFVTADISFSVADADLNRILNDQLPGLLRITGVYYTIFADLSGHIAAGANYHRIVALHDSAIIGGGIGNRDMIFAVDTSNIGEFTISYVANLRRLVLSLDSFTITDLAGNAPTQTMDIRPIMQNNRTMVPLRFVVEFFGAVVTWDGGARGIEIISSNDMKAYFD
ncbi:MAG: copper amine oxidase N-terminal domain-containing protein [Defluviitaleaceae bacterium]|nr:copper amine oxidase N-terminal domain-containing protein [Defluviitaleaceae bacterium]